MNSVKSNELTLPDDMLSRLTNLEIGVLERCRLAEEYREKFQYSYKKMLDITNIPNTTYCKCLKILRSGRNDIIERVINGVLSISAAVQEVSQQKVCILFETPRIIFYLDGEKCKLKIKHGKKILSFDKERAKQIVGLLEDGFVPKRNGFYHSDGRQIRYSMLESRIQNVPFIHKNESGYKAIRISADKIAVLRNRRGMTPVIHTDYSSEMFNVLTGDCIRWHSKSRDKRLFIYIRDCDFGEYLYHIRMAEHLYGLPIDKTGFIETMSRFRNEYLTKGWQVDHLDGNVDNNCLSNLFIMRSEDNNAKRVLTKQIKAPDFWWSTRHDDTTIRVEAGYYTPLSKFRTISGIFTIDDYLIKLRDFVNEIKVNSKIFDYFSDIGD